MKKTMKRSLLKAVHSSSNFMKNLDEHKNKIILQTEYMPEASGYNVVIEYITEEDYETELAENALYNQDIMVIGPEVDTVVLKVNPMLKQDQIEKMELEFKNKFKKNVILLDRRVDYVGCKIGEKDD